jgi:hypothetical protein
VSDNQVTVACATLGKLCQISLLPLRTEQHNTSSEINEINLLNFIFDEPKNACTICDKLDNWLNASFRPKPVLRTTSQSRTQNSQINWALGYFGPSFLETPNPSLANATSTFNVVIIPEGGTENNTLASYDSCANNNDEPIVDMGDQDVIKYVAIYLSGAMGKLQQYAPSGFTFNVNDTYAMQSICAYETDSWVLQTSVVICSQQMRGLALKTH